MAYGYKKKGVWYAGFKDHTGRAVQKKTSARTKTEAKKIAEREEYDAEQIRLGHKTKSADLTMGGLWDLWSKAKGGLASAKYDKLRWKKHLQDAIEHIPMRQLKAVELEKLLHAKLKTNDPPGKLSAGSVHHLRRLVSRMFGWAIEKELWTGTNPTAAVDLPQVDEKIPETADLADIPRILAAAEEPYRTCYAIGIYAGLRSAEILGLEVERVDLETGVLLIDKQSTRATTKGGKFRVVPIVPELRPYLAAHLRAAHLTGVQAGRLFHMPSKDARGHLLGELRRTLKKAGVKDLTLTVHELRHTFISQLIMSGVDPRAAQALAGHADFATTQRYVHLHDAYLIAQVGKLNYTSSPNVSPFDLPSTYPTASEELKN